MTTSAGEPWVLIASECVVIKDEERSTVEDYEAVFWHVMEIWWQKPHALNKRISGSVDIEEQSEEYQRLVQAQIMLDSPTDSVKARRFVPKRCDIFASASEVSVKNEEILAISYYPSSEPSQLKCCHVDIAYRIQLVSRDHSNSVWTLCIFCHPTNRDNDCTAWLKSILLPNLSRWFRNAHPSLKIVETQRLISLDNFTTVYQQLKDKYGKHLVSVWTEKTDPQKFVYEDIAIASYLKVFWDENRTEGKKKQSFADLGCGNGLLCHILGSEGHRAVGLDIRKRAIWERFGAEAELLEQVLDPTNKDLHLPDVDWLVGNHSDELTPWIPIFAAR